MGSAYIGTTAAGGASAFPRAEIGAYFSGAGTSPFSFAKGGRAQCGIMVVNVVWTTLVAERVKNQTGAYLCTSPGDMFSVPTFYNVLLTPGFPSSGGSVSVTQSTTAILVSQIGHTSMTVSYFILA